MLGESPLCPILVGAYGEGPRPIVRGVGAIKSCPRGNIVIRDLHLHGKGLKLLGSGKLENLLFENLLMDNASGAVITPRRVTIRRCVIKNCHRESPPNPKNKPDDGWAREPLRNRHQGLFANSVRGLLVEECVLDHNGWEDGYVESGGGPEDPQPPSMYSHNLYLSTENRDLTVRDNINARAASQALRDGSGQFYVGNVMIANNIGYYGNTSATITFQRDATLSFACDEQGVSTLGEMGGDALTSTLVIAGEDTVLEIDVSQLRLPAGEHQLVLVKVDRLEGRFASERITGGPSASIAEAKIVYDESAGEIRVHLISREKNSQP